MSPKKAILLTILGILAAWLIIRGIQSWEAKHASGSQAFVPDRVTSLCVRSVPEGGFPARIRIL